MDKINFYNGIENGIINHDNYLMKDILNKYRNIRVLDVDGKFHDAKKIFDKYINKSDTYYINDTTYNPYSSSVNIAQAPSGYFNNLNSLIVNNFFLGYGEMSLLSQNPIISNICNIRADSCISNWIEFVSNQNRTKEIKIMMPMAVITKIPIRMFLIDAAMMLKRPLYNFPTLHFQ